MWCRCGLKYSPDTAFPGRAQGCAQIMQQLNAATRRNHGNGKTAVWLHCDFWYIHAVCTVRKLLTCNLLAQCIALGYVACAAAKPPLHSCRLNLHGVFYMSAERLFVLMLLPCAPVSPGWQRWPRPRCVGSPRRCQGSRACICCDTRGPRL